jgi:uncharacterized ferritin-like protein (DUF455 family)
MPQDNNLFARARDCLLLEGVEEKCRQTERLCLHWQRGALQTDPIDLPDVEEAGSPAETRQVRPAQLAKRGFHSLQGRAAMIHAITHIEFSAINLALDAVFRFRDLPKAFYDDWLQVAAEEVMHFRLLRGRLRELGFEYGDFPVHLGLWEQARRTALDPLARMAIVPRMLEARGLDVTPGIMQRFQQAGDHKTADALVIILRDEEGHVEAGSRWFHYLCQQRGLPAEETYFQLLAEYRDHAIRCPLHKEARLRAGFSAAELSRLEAMCAGA